MGTTKDVLDVCRLSVSDIPDLQTFEGARSDMLTTAIEPSEIVRQARDSRSAELGVQCGRCVLQGECMMADIEPAVASAAS